MLTAGRFFSESTLRLEDCNGSNGGPFRALSTVVKSQGGIFWTVSRWSVHSSEETLFLDNMSAPWFILPGTCNAFSKCRLFWAHTRRSFDSLQSRFETRPPWWFMYETTDLLSERTSTCCPRMTGRKNWQAWHTARISRQLMCRVDSSSDHSPKVGLPSHSAPRPLLKASVVKTFLLCAVSRVMPHFSQRGFLQRVRADTVYSDTSLSQRYAVASVMPSHCWNPLFQPELDGSHTKQTQPNYRRSRCHKAQHLLESFERMGGAFLEGSRVALNRGDSLHWDSSCHLHQVDNCTQERYPLAGWQYTLGKVDPEPQAVEVAEEEGPVRCQNRLRLGQNEVVVEVVEYADSVVAV